MDATTALPAPAATAARQRWLLLGLLVIFAVINIAYVLKVINSDRPHRSAFLRWRVQIHALAEGENIWQRYNYPNPPIMALILRPFAELPPLIGSIAWFYFKALLTVLAVGWVLRLLDTPSRPFPLWGQGLAVLLALRPIEGDLVHGNVNLFIMFLVVAVLYALTCRRGLLAGLTLGLAIACKVTPALIVPYLVWKRAWAALAGTAAGLLLFLWLVPGLVLGWTENQDYLATWWRNMVVPYALEGKVTTEHQNQSLPGLLHRLLTDSASVATYEEDEYVVLERHNVTTLNPRHVGWLVKGCAVLFGLLVLWRCRAPLGEAPAWPLVAEFGIIVLGMLLFSERTWKHHCVTLLIPFAVLTYAATSGLVGGWRRWTLAGTLAGAALLIALTSTGLFDRQDRIGKLAQVYGAYVGAHLLLLGGLLLLLGRRTEAGAATEVQ